MSEESNTVEELRDAIYQLTHQALRELGHISLNTAAATLAQEAIRAIGHAGFLYRIACKSKSRTDFYNSLGPVADEVDQVAYWLQLALDSELLPERHIAPVLKLAQTTSSRITAARLSGVRRSSRESH